MSDAWSASCRCSSGSRWPWRSGWASAFTRSGTRWYGYSSAHTRWGWARRCALTMILLYVRCSCWRSRSKRRCHQGNTSRGTYEQRTIVCAAQTRARAPPLVAAKSGQSPARPSRSLGAGGKLMASCTRVKAQGVVRSDRYETRTWHTPTFSTNLLGEDRAIDCALCYFIHISMLAPLMLQTRRRPSLPCA